MKRLIEWILIAGILILAFKLRYTDPYCLADLAIVPDSAQYAVAGYNLAHHKGLRVYINDLKLPLMYPPGFPLILALFYCVSSAALHQAIYVVLVSSLVSILLVYLFARSVFDVPTALLAALLLSVAPLYVGYSQVLISDMVSNVFIVAGLWLAWRAANVGGQRLWLWFFAGVNCGFSAAIHMLSGITVVPLALACLLGARGRMREAICSLSLSAGGFIIGFSPVLAYNAAAFGSMFKDGYNYWERWEGGSRYFSFWYAFANTAVSERGDERGNIVYFMWHFLGLSWPTLFAPYFFGVLLCACIGGAASLACARGLFKNKLFAWGVVLSVAFCAMAAVILIASGTATVECPAVYPFCILAAVSVAVATLVIVRGPSFLGERPGTGIRIFGAMSVAFILVTLSVLLFYAYQMAKFFLPVIPFMCVLAAYGIVILIRLSRGQGMHHRFMRVGVITLIAVTAWGCWRPFAGGDYSGRAPTWWYEGLRVLDSLAPQDAVLISGIDGVYVTHYFIHGTQRAYMPVARGVEYIRQKNLPLVVPGENIGYLRQLLAQGKKIYMDGFTYQWWARNRVELERDFILVPVAPYYGGKLFIYELIARKS
ncbi:MAG: glycosyltransferase family 39 protein [Candidatus Aureabacteria bacterium]|nr:glycosyltransferase family 39 protein [Candidatus Auribacterota bacterium]